MNRYEFHLHLSPEQYLDYYRGLAKHIVVRSTQGLTIQFPASLLQKFVTEEGVHGHFVLVCDDRHKCHNLERVGPS